MTAELEALAGRVEREPFQELSRELLLEIFRTARPRSSFDSGRDCDRTRHAFVSLWEAGGALDAAIMLVPKGWNWMAGNRNQPLARAWVENGELAFVGVGTRRNPARRWFETVAATPALALCAAALRARASTPTQNHKGPHDE